MAAILGYSPFATAHNVWARILHGTSVEETPAMARGTRLESVVCDIARDYLKADENLSIRVPWEGSSVFHPTLKMFHGTVDALVYSGDKLVGVLEIKTTTARKKWDTNRPDYNLQGQHYLWVYNDWLRSRSELKEKAINGKDLEFWWLACLQADEAVFSMIDSYEDAIHAIERGSARFFVDRKQADPNYSSVVVPALVSWWDEYIETKTIPPIDGSDGCTVALRRMYPDRSGSMEMTDALETLAREKKRISSEIKGLESEKGLIDNQIKHIMGNYKSCERNGVKITVTNQPGRMRFSQSNFKEDHPDTFTKYMKKGSDFDQLLVRVKKEEKEVNDV